MQHARFAVLTGHLSDYPLSDLCGILRRQRKTGRLLIEYPAHPGIFYFKDGDLVDAQLGALGGLQAVCVALAQPNASFNFNPLIQPERYTINNSLRKVIMELLGHWDEGASLDIEASAKEGTPASLELATSAPLVSGSSQEMLTAEKNVLALPPPSPASNRADAYRGRQILLISAINLLMLCVLTSLALTGRFGKKDESLSSLPPSTTAPIHEAPSSSNAASASAPSNKESNASFAPVHEAGVGQSKAHRSKRERSKEEINRTFLTEEKESPASPTEKNARNAKAAKEDDTARSDERTVKVLMRVENGRVVEAFVANSRPGMEAYEALALRIARQRRYPAKAGGQETILFKVNQPK